MIDLHDPDERLASAGEYVLGTLSPADVATVEAALPQMPALQRDIYAWQDRLLALSARAAPVDPSRGLWRRIEVAVEASPPSARGSTHATHATHAVHATRETLDVPPWWRRVLPWQLIGGLALASTAGLAFLLVQRTVDVERLHYLAVLQSPTDRANGWIVDVRAGGSLRLIPVAGQAPLPVPAGRSLQFWTKPQGANAPTSLGLVHAGEALELPTSTLPGVGEQQLFEITLEPANGSPIGKPTGPILFVGRTVHL